jgi:low affinity Fe/Cu permease
VSFNLKVLGGETSFFQSVSVLGYCILPLFIALLIVEFLKIFGVKNQLVVILIVAASVIWCVFGKNS